jgi:hypothetical protein
MLWGACVPRTSFIKYVVLVLTFLLICEPYARYPVYHDVLPSGFHAHNLYEFYVCPMRASLPADLILSARCSLLCVAKSSSNGGRNYEFFYIVLLRHPSGVKIFFLTPCSRMASIYVSFSIMSEKKTTF